MNTDVLVKNIAKFHKNYKTEFLIDRIKKKDLYLKDTKEALFFIFSFSFYQGRRDKISKQFEEMAKTTLDQVLKNNKILTQSESRIINKEELKTKYHEIYNKLKENKVNKEGDRLMVISLINLIQCNKEKNMLKFLMEKIKSKAICDAYEILDGVWSIGPKIASLILRDIVYIYKLEKYLKKPDDYYFLQPIDTWVHKISRKVGLINKDKIYKDEAKDITDKCFEIGVNPIHYNQGVWYIGANSLQIVLRNIERIK